jgi:MoxR-like ATPase
MEIKDQIKLLLEKLNEGVYEKEEVIALSLLSSIAGESIFLLGAPGVAKSLVARKLKYAFKDGTSFEYLMNRFSTPDEIFGPVSISQLKDNDKYERIVKNYLPTATVVFLDEIWKAGPSIQNSLLTVLNEKIYRNGDQEIKVPMKALISASNELPSKGEGLEALWDRFLVRLIVDGVKDKQNFNDMISKSLNSYSDTVNDELKTTDKAYENWDKEIDKIEVPENVFNVIHVIRNYIDQHNNKEENKDKQIYISDRRWRKIVRLLRTSAFLNDRKAVDLMDCFLIKHCIWNEAEQIQTVSQFINDAIQKHGYKLGIDLKDLKDEIQNFNTEVTDETSFIKPITKERLKEYNKKYLKIANHNEDIYIDITEYKNLKNDRVRINLYSKYNRNYEHHRTYYASKGTAKDSILMSRDSYYQGQQYFIEKEEYKEDKSYTKKPHDAVKKQWDKEVAKYLTTTSNLKHQINHYRETDLKHIKVNLFVNPSLAEIVESNLISLEKEIDKIDIEVKRIQHYYENVEDQTAKAGFKALN